MFFWYTVGKMEQMLMLQMIDQEIKILIAVLTATGIENTFLHNHLEIQI